MKSVLVWDWPLRIFHWSLAVLVIAAAVTANVGGNAMDWHGRIGVAIAGLLGFRVAWGVIGSTHARFADFLPWPGALLAYLRGEWRGLGHNPLGALSVLAMLSALAAQVAVGLFANDDIAFNGPLYPLVSKETSDALTAWHHRGIWLIGLLVAAHLGAIAFYARVKGDNLVKPMLSGVKLTDDAQAESARGGGPLALMLALLIGCGVAWVAAGGLLAPPAPPAAVEVTPAW